jgi:vesicle transport through interaction with t-SNAREs 1
LNEARQHATAMQGMAEIENDMIKIHNSKMLVERDINPLAKELKRTLDHMIGRQDLFGGQQQQQHAQQQSQSQYRPPDIELGNSHNDSAMMESLIMSSEDLLRDSQAILAETEQIGTQSLLQMGRQREQLHNATSSLQTVQNGAYTAGMIMASMSRRAFKNRLALYCMITTLGLLNVFVLYRIYKKHHPTSAPSNHEN